MDKSSRRSGSFLYPLLKRSCSNILSTLRCGSITGIDIGGCELLLCHDNVGHRNGKRPAGEARQAANGHGGTIYSALLFAQGQQRCAPGRICAEQGAKTTLRLKRFLLSAPRKSTTYPGMEVTLSRVAFLSSCPYSRRLPECGGKGYQQQL